MPTIQSIVQVATEQLQRVSDSPVLDAELLLSLVINKNRTYLRTWPEQQLNPQQIERFQTLLHKRLLGQPIAYLLGVREFWSREFMVTPEVLIPRPETELLVEMALAAMPADQVSNIIDLGTGSGAIAVTLAAERPLATVTATDTSQSALDIARQNAERLGISNIHFRRSNWFEQLSNRDFDVIVSNPPYIAQDDPHLSQGDVRFEPDLALISDQKGLSDLTIIIDHARRHIKPGGTLLLEHGYNQQDQVQSILTGYKYTSVKTYCDLSGHPRVTVGRWQA